MDTLKSLIKTKILVDYLIEDFSNCYKLLFMVEELKLSSPKQLCAGLHMAKSNLAVLAGKLRLLKYLEQHKSSDNKKEIVYKVTPLGKSKLENKIKEQLSLVQGKEKLIQTLKQSLDDIK